MNIKNVAVALVTLIASSAAYGAYGQSQAVQWRVEDGGNGNWYAQDSRARTWLDAQAYAESVGAHLATPTSAAENYFIFMTSGGTGNTWIGGRQAPDSCEPGCGWQWVTGETWNFTAWQEIGPQPDNTNGNENHLAYWGIEGGPGRWNDGDGITVTAPFTVEWSADCNGDGIVDYGQCRDGSLPDYNGNNIPDCCESGTACVVGNYPVQWRVEDGGNGHWYMLQHNGSQVCWSTASALAQGIGGYLASEATESEHSFVASRLVSRADAWSGRWGPWIGGLYVGGSWTWTSGEPWSFTAWQPGEPNGGGSETVISYIAQGEGGGCGRTTRWNDWIDCGSGQDSGCDVGVWNYIVEWSADCNNDGIVDIGQIYLQPELYADANSNGIPDSCEVDPCPGDITGGGFVDAIDLSILLAFWGSTGGGEFDADVNNDGIVEGADLTIVLTGWGPCPN